MAEILNLLHSEDAVKDWRVWTVGGNKDCEGRGLQNDASEEIFQTVAW